MTRTRSARPRTRSTRLTRLHRSALMLLAVALLSAGPAVAALAGAPTDLTLKAEDLLELQNLDLSMNLSKLILLH